MQIEIPKTQFIGQLNESVVSRSGPRGLAMLTRHSFPNRHIFNSISDEYHDIGFTQMGGRVRRRTPEEQYSFMRYCAQEGLRVIPPFGINRSAIDLPFLGHAETLDIFMAHADVASAEKVAHDLLLDMSQAHQKGVVYGDRWSKNILVDPKYGPMHIDFDLEISGPVSADLDLAQMGYYILCGGKGKVISIIAQFLGRIESLDSLHNIETFLRRHARHFFERPTYGHVMEETETVIDSMFHIHEQLKYS